MKPFSLARPRDFAGAGKLAKDRRFSLPVIKAGGMDVVDHLKEGLIEPDLLIDVLRIDDQPEIREANGTLRIHANTTLATIAASRSIARRAPVIAQCCASAATPQVRNVATAAGNLLQRPRCWYYRNSQFDCLKKGGHRCFAFDGENAYHAIFGDGPCHIVHPSNLAIGLSVCNASVRLTGSEREAIAIADLFHMPDRGLRSEHNLKTGEVVTEIHFEPRPASAFYAIKHKQSFDWPLVAAAAALELDGDRIESATVTAGAVAPVPWALPHVGEALVGVSLDDDTALRRACATSTRDARPMSDNEYKVRLLPVAIRRAILKAAGREVMS